MKFDILKENQDNNSEVITMIKDTKFSYTILKRLIDIIGSSLGIILLIPIFIIVIVIMKLEEPKGSILFKQKRVGIDGELFLMLKFRSMVVNAEELLVNLLDKNESNGPMFKIKDDPRITKIGKIMRKTSIDELPQLINVLKGEMSLVGPRPPLPREVDHYSLKDKQRLLVVPGCTGLWQVSGRSKLSFEQMVQLDLEYIKNRGVFTDLKIIFKTIALIFYDKNAY